jgi:RNA-directed DNA polymerase
VGIDDLPGQLYKLWNRLSSGSYFPQPVKAVQIPKKGGGTRPLGIPTLLDRIAQQVVKHHLEMQLEPLFHASSFGYRPNRSAHDAVAQSQRNCFNHDFAIDLDIKGYFDNIDHDLMMQALRHYCKDKWVHLHRKTEKQALFMMRAIEQRMKSCKLTLHPEKTKIVNLRGRSEKRYARKYDFLGFSIRPVRREVNGRWLLLPGTFVSQKSKKAIREKFRELEIHKRRIPIEELAQKLNPIIRGLINYYHKFWQAGMRDVWNGLNHRLLKWVKWEKGLYKYASVKWLKQRYRENPGLFVHWKLVQP